MTLEAWVFPTTVNSAWRDVIYKGSDNYYLEATSSNSGRPAVGGIFNGTYGEAYGTANLAANAWTHLAATYDGATLRLYVNGTQVSSSPRSGAIATSGGVLSIGGDPLYGQYFIGRIDEVRIYSSALTQAQIQTDMAAPIGGAAAARHHPADRAHHPPGHRRQLHPDQPQLGRRDRQRRRHRLPARALPGRRLHRLHPDRDPHRHHRHRQRASPPPPATPTASAPPTPPPTSAPTRPPPPPSPSRPGPVSSPPTPSTREREPLLRTRPARGTRAR